MTRETTHASSTGDVLSAPDWLDVHFAACRAAYEALLDAAGFEAGMRVLDAGAGTGPFLPLLQDRVGPAGEVHALDVASENIDEARRVAPWARLVIGSITQLPYRDGAFDGLWGANVLQYFDDAGAASILAEMRRVVRRGGLVAIKDVDMSALKLWPAPPFLGLHLAEACVTGEDATVQSFGSLRGRDLRRFLIDAGLSNVRQTPLLIEHTAPLDEAGRQLWSDWLPYLAQLALTRELPAADLAVWRSLDTPAKALAYVSQPEFYACELQVTATGTVP